MKKFLPVFFIAIFLLFQIFVTPVNAVEPPTFTDTSELCAEIPDGEWCPYPDKDVTFYGKSAVRARDFLDLTLRNPQWSTFNNSALSSFWGQIRTIVNVFFVLLVLTTAFILIITRGRSITAKKFIPRFVIILLLVTFSFSLVQFFYQITDVIQGFFLSKGSKAIDTTDLLNIAFRYNGFLGFRIAGVGYDESVFTSLFLVKLTSVTYYIMAGVLLFRKILLWFFIAMSPIFPLLLLYAPIRNSAKIWIGEFFRWLLYGPIFAILLSGLVSLWRAGIPLLNFSSSASGETYPVAINILIGGPGQPVDLSHSLNSPESFGIYIVALLMLWAVIILPFILLQIFLDYFHSSDLSQNVFFQQLLAKTTLATAVSPSSVSTTNTFATSSIARALPFMNRFFSSVNTTVPSSAAPSVAVSGATPRVFQSQSGAREGGASPVTRESSSTISSVAANKGSQSAGGATFVPRVSLSGFKLPEEKEKTVIQKESRTVAGPTPVRQNQQGSSAASRASVVSQVDIKVPKGEDQKKESTVKENLTTQNTTTSRQDQSTSSSVSSSGVVSRTDLKVPTAPSSSASSAQTVLSSNPKTTNQTASFVSPASLSGFTLPQQEGKENISSQNPNKDIAKLANAPTLQRANLSIPSIKEIAGFDSATIRSNIQTHQEIAKTHETLESIANPNIVMQQGIKTEFTKARDELEKEKEKGNPVAGAVLTAAASVSHARPSQGQKTGVQIQDTAIMLPTSNRVQAVKPEEFEEVKKTWTNNYTKLEPPRDLHGKQKKRSEWISQDIEKLTKTIELLKSGDEAKNKEAMTMVGNILPFLLIGGFSREEVIKYLESKLAAAQNAAGKMQSEKPEEDKKEDKQSQKNQPPTIANEDKAI